MAHWRDTYRPARFFFMDARAGLPLLGSLLHVRLWKVGLAGAVLVLFWFLARTGMSFASAARAARSWLAGIASLGRPPPNLRPRVDSARNRCPANIGSTQWRGKGC